MAAKSSLSVGSSACAVGLSLENRESCNQLSFSSLSGFLNCDKFSDKEIELIQHRSGCFGPP